jgi:hypothetical protein
MSKRLLSESQVNRWAKLSGVKLNENYGMSGEREEDAPMDDMGGDMPAEDGGEDMGDMGADMGAEGGESEMTVEDDQLMAMIEKAVENVLVKMGLGDEGGGEGGGDELAEPDTEHEAGESEEEEAGEQEEGDTEMGEDETLAEMVSDDEIINETLKRVIKRLVG